MGLFSTKHNDRMDLEPLRHSGIKTEEVIPTPYSSDHASGPQPSYQRFLKSPMREQSRWAVLVQRVCRVLSVLVSLCIVGLLARVLSVYNSTKNYKVIMSSGVLVSAWPFGNDRTMMPIYLLLGAAAAGFVFGLLVALWGLVRSKKHSGAAGSGAATAWLPVTLLGLFVAALTLYKLIDGANGAFGWSCDHRDVETIYDDNELGLGRVCDDMNAAWDLGIVVASLELITLVVIILGFAGSKERRRKTLPFITGRTGYSELGPRTDEEN
ncbi:hypothetical protein BX600DRAFT_552007 [Xylariales sp. PMI_506]|nr:hypothetical protein BX600DRAFT_552007 [Xylariales sp. PMI_506]